MHGNGMSESMVVKHFAEYLCDKMNWKKTWKNKEQQQQKPQLLE